MKKICKDRATLAVAITCIVICVFFTNLNIITQAIVLISFIEVLLNMYYYGALPFTKYFYIRQYLEGEIDKTTCKKGIRHSSYKKRKLRVVFFYISFSAIMLSGSCLDSQGFVSFVMLLIFIISIFYAILLARRLEI
jgi:hypothetical protein